MVSLRNPDGVSTSMCGDGVKRLDVGDGVKKLPNWVGVQMGVRGYTQRRP